MNKIISLIKRAPKRTAALVLMIAAAVIVPASIFAWGPERETFTIDNPANYVTFNSITDNPNIGDERNFVGIRESGTDDLWSDDMTVEKDKTYTVRMYVHNNAAENLDLVAKDVTAKFNLPTETSKSIQVNGFLSSSNATPKEVYDHAKFNSDQNFNLAYVDNTLKFENNVFGPEGVSLSEDIFTSKGVELGYDELNGEIPGCFEYAGYVTFRVTPQFAAHSEFEMNKMVSKHGENDWKDSYTAKPGEKVDFLIEYKNIGEAPHENVVLRDTLPEDLSYINGSTIYGNFKNPDGVKASDNLTNGTGINVGYYAPGSNAWAIFTAEVAGKDALECGKNTLTNVAKVTVDGGYIEDTADVIVSKECEEVPPETPPELPETGVGSTIAAVVGLGSIVTSLGYYIASRRAAADQA